MSRSFLSVLVLLSAGFLVLDAGTVRAAADGADVFGSQPQSAQSVQSVQSVESPFRLGIRIGVLMSDLSYDEALPAPETDGSLLSWRAGVDARRRLSSSATLASGLHYVRKGGTAETKGPVTLLGLPFEADLDSDFVFHYLAIPLGVEVGKPGPGVRPFVRGGLELALLLSARGKTKGTLVDGEGFRSNLDSQSDLRNVNEVEVGFDAGVGLTVPWERRSLIVELGGTLGLTDTAERGDGARHRTLAISSGLRF